MDFENIKNIRIDDEKSWRDRIFLTFDVEWASDEILTYILDMVFEADIKATFFCTHPTDLLLRMRQNPKIELGIHPNFNFLLDGDFSYGKCVDEIIKYYKIIVPDAVSVRSHALTQGSLFSNLFSENGLHFDCNPLVPYSAHIKLAPWLDFYKDVIRIPFFWEDDVHCKYGWNFDIDQFLAADGLKVFNFHPITTFLNIENLTRYTILKKDYRDYAKLYDNRYHGYGIQSMLKDLLRIGNT